jgi:hypothetical protein
VGAVSGGAGYVVSDYGAHIMYYASRLDYGNTGGVIKLDSQPVRWTSNLQLTTYKQAIFEQILKEKQDNSFSKKQKEIVTTYRAGENYVVIYDKRYKDLWENTKNAASA